MASSSVHIFLLLWLLSVYVIIFFNFNAPKNLISKWKGIEILKLENVPLMSVTEVDCHGLFAGKEDSVRQAEKRQKYMNANRLKDRQVADLAEDCETYKHHRGYILQPVSVEAYHFPLAFGIIAFEDAEMVERLLRAIYRPQNYYCIHIDKKASEDFRNAIQTVTGCFQNVFTSTMSINVKWGEFSVLEANMICMRELWKYKAWKYFINLTGQEFPLKTNLEMVKIVKAFNGANDINISLSKQWRRRWNKRLQLSAPPNGIRLGKGEVHVVLSRAFVNYTLHDKVARDFYNWLNGTKIPDESFFNSLFISPAVNVPGAYTGQLNMSHLEGKSVLRLKNWSLDHKCSDRVRHGVCILTIHDLPDMAISKKIIANKFHSGYHPLAYSCMEQLIAERVSTEVITGESSIDINYYRKVSLVPHRQ